jgi:hypothetical protein
LKKEQDDRFCLAEAFLLWRSIRGGVFLERKQLRQAHSEERRASYAQKLSPSGAVT